MHVAHLTGKAHGHADAYALGMPMHLLVPMPIGKATAAGLPRRSGLKHFRVTPMGVPCLCGWLPVIMKSSDKFLQEQEHLRFAWVSNG